MSDDSSVNRRKVLQAVAGGGLFSAVASERTTAASTYDWALYSSDELDAKVGETAQNRGETYTKGAFGNIPQDHTYHSPTATPPAPVENLGESFTTNKPCSNIEYQYQGILPWWKDYAEGDCNNIDPASTANILLLEGNDGAGGVAYRNGNYGVHDNGTSLTDLNSTYERYGLAGNSGPEAGSTLLEEIGHIFQESGDYNVEKTGDHDYVDGTNYVSPLGEGAQGEQNECGISVANSNGKKLEWDNDCSADVYFQ